MKKKKYVAPEISVIEMDPLQIMAGSLENDRGWSPDGDEKNGFGIVEEGDDDYKDDDF
ncbi:hypothetical protein [Leyella stercorea]|jgi:hypothetical protein|uniref:hypothetical protein n=1 Tax=Leyella stercorea TaxID=363265 RepID=UPI00242FAA05|nr:hypothetical protein [Leyella stercorea]